MQQVTVTLSLVIYWIPQCLYKVITLTFIYKSIVACHAIIVQVGAEVPEDIWHTEPSNEKKIASSAGQVPNNIWHQEGSKEKMVVRHVAPKLRKPRNLPPR